MNKAKNTKSPAAKIAIIGTEGAGKTVFVTVWSKFLEKQEEGRPFIIPDPSTYAYIEKNWSKLRNGQWPESTPQSEFVNLFWRLKMPSGHICQINVCDVAGHDIRRLFTGNRPQSSDDPTKAIYDTLAAANIVLVIINLKDFITTTEVQRIDNCANLLSMLQYMFDQKKKVALVFSQWHEYEAWVASHGDVENVLRTYMPAVYNTCCLEGEISYFNVAAVVETTSNVEINKLAVNPAPNFTSTGFSELNNWIIEVVDGTPLIINNPKHGENPLLATSIKNVFDKIEDIFLSPIYLVLICLAGLVSWAISALSYGTKSNGLASFILGLYLGYIAVVVFVIYKNKSIPCRVLIESMKKSINDYVNNWLR